VGDVIAMTLGDLTGEFSPGCRLAGYESGVTARFPGLLPGSNMTFQMKLDLKGSRGIQFAPVGQKTRVSLTSLWPDPSFIGAFLPTDRKVGDEGFRAAWEVSWYGRSYPQQTTDQAKNYAFAAGDMASSLFGVNFISVVDAYRMVERAAKYGILFIALIFTAFFLFEILSALSIHTFQYTLVGAALCLFYLALLSLSEFISFGLAYWAGAAASSILIVLYTLNVLGGGWRTLIITLSLATIYTYLYVVLQLQDYSLLIGTAGLFVVLGLVMYVTRNVDWANRD
jgi:inner membrane protein